MKSKSEVHWNEVKTQSFLENRQSLSQHNRLRLALSFETPDEANKRAKQRKENEAMRLRRPRKAFKKSCDVNFDKDRQLAEVKGYLDRTKVIVTNLVGSLMLIDVQNILLVTVFLVNERFQLTKDFKQFSVKFSIRKGDKIDISWIIILILKGESLRIAAH